MIARNSFLQGVLIFVAIALALNVAVGATTCTPMRPLAEPSQWPMPAGPTFFVDAGKGDDHNDGSKEKPWKTINYATGKLKPGDTLCLRGGIFHERVRVSVSGEKGRPITIRGCPGELAILDGGILEYLESPSTAWEPAKDGAKDEYVSKKVYSDWKMPKLVGSLADSMVPLIGYGFSADLSAGEDGVWKLKDKADAEPGVYCGPGISFNETDHRIHVRLARTRFDWLNEGQNYRGETDPRKVPLIIAGNVTEAVLTVKKGHHLRFQDLVLRGSGRQPLIDLDADEDLEFDGLTCHGGYPGLRANSTRGLRIINSAFRGQAAPWSSRALMKYRSKPSYILISSPGQPLNADWEIAQCEFTDGHDFAHLREIHNLRFHHNFVDNFNDDGLEMGPRTKDQLAWIYCNRISRCLSFITQHETITTVDFDPGTGIYIFRNVIDMRQPTYGSPRRADMAAGGADEDREMWRTCELGTDHKSPIWCNYYFYQNTVLKKEPAWRDQYAFGFAVRGLTGPPRPWNGEKTIRSPRRVFNNIFLQVEGLPGLVLPPKPEEVDMQTDGNLFWGIEQGPTFKGDFFAKVRQSKTFDESKKQFPSGWAAHDVFGDPKFAQWTNEKGKALDLSLQKSSPAVNAGVKIPADWVDPLRDQDKDAPDIGALPLGVAPWKVGVNGRIPVFP